MAVRQAGRIFSLDMMTSHLPATVEPVQQAPRFRPCPWVALNSPHEAELWIDEHNRSMQEHIASHERGCGVRLTLAQGGDIFMQTNGDGAVILDVTHDAAWVAPLICAATRTEAPDGSLWILPDDTLVELLVGLSGLVASSMLVVAHPFGNRSRRAASR